MLQRISINHDFYRRDPTRPYYEESVEDYGFVILGNLSIAYNEYNNFERISVKSVAKSVNVKENSILNK